MLRKIHHNSKFTKYHPSINMTNLYIRIYIFIILTSFIMLIYIYIFWIIWVYGIRFFQRSFKGTTTSPNQRNNCENDGFCGGTASASTTDVKAVPWNHLNSSRNLLDVKNSRVFPKIGVPWGTPKWMVYNGKPY